MLTQEERYQKRASFAYDVACAKNFICLCVMRAHARMMLHTYTYKFIISLDLKNTVCSGTCEPLVTISRYLRQTRMNCGS